MSDKLADLQERIGIVSEVIRATDASLVETKLARGMLWRELADWSEDAVAASADVYRVDLSVVKQERWMSDRYPMGAPRDWLTWYALRALATFDDDDRETIIRRCEDMGVPTSEAVAREARAEKARRRGAGADSPNADPVTAETLEDYLRARIEAEFGIDFDQSTIDKLVTVVTGAVAEYERAGAATVESVFGRVQVEA